MPQITDLTITYGEKTIFSHLTLTLPDTGITLLAGPSGIGKTTLLQALFRQRPATTAFLYQENRLFPWRTAAQHIADVLPKQRQNEVANFLALVDLLGEENAYPNQLSGGMARRLALARTIALGGDFYLLDEPFAGVDFPRQTLILQRLRDMQLPILLTGHAESLHQFMDKVLVLDDYLCKGLD